MQGIVRRIFKWILIIVSLIAIGIVSAFFTLNILSYGKAVEVPALTGKNVVEANSLLNQKGLYLRVEGEDYDVSIPPGYIIRQDIPAMTRVKEGRSIRVVLSKGARFLYVPSFEGKTIDDAEASMAQNRLRPGIISMAHSSTVEKDRVIAQNPRPGESGGDVVNLLVSLGPPDIFYICPNFVGKGIEECKKLSDDMGLKPVITGTGIIVSAQQPVPGSIIKKGDTVELYLKEEGE